MVLSALVSVNPPTPCWMNVEPPPPFSTIWPAFKICVPNTESCVPRLVVRMLPVASCRSATDALVSRVTVLVPFVIQTLVALLLGNTAGFQSPLVLQLPFPPMFHVVRLLSVH